MASRFRMVVHASALLIPFLAEATSKSIVLFALTAISVAYALSETLRLKGRQVPLVTRFTIAMSRENESLRFVAAPVYLALGTILSLLVFPRSIAYATITIVAVADPVTSYVGSRFGRIHVKGKTLEGCAAGLILSFVAALLWVPAHLALTGSVAGILFEVLGVLDDNLTIPIGAGSAMLIVSIL